MAAEYRYSLSSPHFYLSMTFSNLALLHSQHGASWRALRLSGIAQLTSLPSYIGERLVRTVGR